jgi:hypothetical protein
MPWKECHVMDERLRFVARLLEGEKMAPVVRRVPDLRIHHSGLPLRCSRPAQASANTCRGRKEVPRAAA